MANQTEAMTNDELQPYELAYLLSPLTMADKVDETTERLMRAALLGVEARIEGEERARMIALAYPLKRVVENKASIFREAYFGAIYFEAKPESVIALEAAWRQAPELIRCLLIKSSPESKRWRARRASLALANPVDKDRGSVEVAHGSIEASTEAIDKEIEGMLIGTGTETK